MGCERNEFPVEKFQWTQDDIIRKKYKFLDGEFEINLPKPVYENFVFVYREGLKEIIEIHCKYKLFCAIVELLVNNSHSCIQLLDYEDIPEFVEMADYFCIDNNVSIKVDLNDLLIYFLTMTENENNGENNHNKWDISDHDNPLVIFKTLHTIERLELEKSYAEFLTELYDNAYIKDYTAIPHGISYRIVSKFYEDYVNRIYNFKLTNLFKYSRKVVKKVMVEVSEGINIDLTPAEFCKKYLDELLAINRAEFDTDTVYACNGIAVFMVYYIVYLKELEATKVRERSWKMKTLSHIYREYIADIEDRLSVNDLKCKVSMAVSRYKKIFKIGKRTEEERKQFKLSGFLHSVSRRSRKYLYIYDRDVDDDSYLIEFNNLNRDFVIAHKKGVKRSRN